MSRRSRKARPVPPEPEDFTRGRLAALDATTGDFTRTVNDGPAPAVVSGDGLALIKRDDGLAFVVSGDGLALFFEPSFSSR